MGEGDRTQELERRTRLDRFRDPIVYAIAGIGLVPLGLVWKGALSMILAPFWMLLVVWLVPSRIERLVRGADE